MIPAFLLVLFVVAYRIAAGLLIQSGAGWLSNFAPFAAIALCCGAYFPARFKLSVPLIGLFLSDAVLNVYYSAPMFTGHIVGRYLALALIALFWNSFAESGVTQNFAARFARQFHALLRCQHLFFLG